MEIPPEITFRNIDRSEAIENLIADKAAKLDNIHENIVSCRVAVEKPQTRQESGCPYRVRIALRVPPGKELVVRREAGEGDVHDPLQAVINEAFDAMRRQLLKLKDKQRGNIKVHPAQDQRGLVVQLFNEQGYGFIKTTEGRELYFHRNSVLNDEFDRLAIGTGVRYVAEEGENGPQASTLQIIDKPGKGAAFS